MRYLGLGILLITCCIICSCNYYTYTYSYAEIDPDLPVPIIYHGSVIYVHPRDTSISVKWGPKTIVTYSTSMDDGAKNTEKILRIQGSGEYAANLCDTLVSFGHSDWYLPSIQELDALNKQSYMLKGMNKFGYYWSSTEASIDKTWVLYALTGEIRVWDKDRTFHCRCVRKD